MGPAQVGELKRQQAASKKALARRVETARSELKAASKAERLRLDEKQRQAKRHVANAESAEHAKRQAKAAKGEILRRAADKAEEATARASAAVAALAGYDPQSETKRRPLSAPRARPASAPATASPKKRGARRPGTKVPSGPACGCCRGSLTAGAVDLPHDFCLGRTSQRDFCSWECAKAWNHVAGPPPHRFIRDALVDMKAGRFVEVDASRFRRPGPEHQSWPDPIFWRPDRGYYSNGTKPGPLSLASELSRACK